MSQKTHVMHGRDHLPGGADPIPLLPPTTGGFVEQVLGHPHLVHYWRMGASTGDQPDLVVDPYPKDLIPDTFSATGVYDVPGALAAGEDDGAFEFNGGGVDATTWFHTDSTAPPHRANFPGYAPFTIECWAWINPAWTEGLGALVCMAGTSTIYWSFECYAQTDAGPPELSAGPPYRLRLYRSTTGHLTSLGISPGVWHHLVATYDGATSRIYLDGELWFSEANTDSVSVSSSQTVRVGFRSSTPYNAYFWGRVDEVALYDVALSAAEVASHYGVVAGGGGPGVAGGPGSVLTVGDDGVPTWELPTIQVSGGGGEPDETPVSADGGGSGATSASGWHLNAHIEAVVLYDSTPGRFDVPSRRWTRVPFDTVRVWRQWETTAGLTNVKQAWLPDDRGLTGAPDGVLHINADMVWSSANKTLGGYYSIEYPVLDYLGLPDEDPSAPWGGYGPRPAVDPDPSSPIAPDDYLRAARMVNASDGTVVRLSPTFPTWRHFFQWEFHNDADGIASAVNADGVDNLYPIYPDNWPGRPLSMALPYPKLSPTESLDYYTNYLGQLGFMEQNLEVVVDPDAGANFCLQAWQDSPWLLRFSTDRFPNYTREILPAYLARPHLAFSFRYDPETVDHTTGKLLL